MNILYKLPQELQIHTLSFIISEYYSLKHMSKLLCINNDQCLFLESIITEIFFNVPNLEWNLNYNMKKSIYINYIRSNFQKLSSDKFKKLVNKLKTESINIIPVLLEKWMCGWNTFNNISQLNIVSIIYIVNLGGKVGELWYFLRKRYYHVAVNDWKLLEVLINRGLKTIYTDQIKNAEQMARQTRPSKVFYLFITDKIGYITKIVPNNL